MSKICPVFIPFAGCANKCLYCDQSSLTGFSQSEIIHSTVSQIKAVTSSGSFNKIAFFGGSFTCLSAELRKTMYRISREYGFENIRVSTRPDCISKEIVDELKINCITEVELGIQTLNDKALSENLRPYDAEKALKSLKMSCKNFYTVAQVMPGMYGDSTDEFLSGFENLLTLKPQGFRIYPTVVFKNTPLEKYYKDGKYTPLTLSEALQISLYCTAACINNGIEILRIGIPTENLDYSDIAAGPFHPAFGDLIRTLALMLYFSKIGNNLISSKDSSRAAGYKSLVKKLSLYKITDRKDIGRLNIHQVYKFIREQFIEDNFRLFQGQANHFAKILEYKAHYR
ncbi:MAG: radical SAM protein [Flexistipes sinusarabici]|uniref:Radical SAM protein n=1 Tax=Flexistipes sinusarabici TaxID=2352 RepID=A0A5D0MHU3_FLESI|nr:radical SAM protein [Flexistipes sinusarabici]TYB32546.1 MAG: radical SAM protein [Flexistipes sinusarabici]